MKKTFNKALTSKVNVSNTDQKGAKSNPLTNGTYNDEILSNSQLS